jgi:exodeoxyribonuclease-1
MSSFLFYDIETSGLNKSFDQVLQFASIRTDLELNELESTEVIINLAPDTIISPEALLVHKLGPNFCSAGIDQLNGIKKIHTILNSPGTISLGYNTLGFDDEFLRFKFHQHLLQPYTHQFANNCSRADLYPMLIMYYLFSPEIINWDKANKSMKLENINKVNNFTTGQSHNAIYDVIATIELAKKMKQNNSMWEYLLGYFNKFNDQTRILNLTEINNKKVGIYIEGSLGWNKNFNSPVLYLGRHRIYKNQTIWLILDEKLPKSIEDINKLIIRKKDGEPGFIIPFNRGDKLWSNEQINFINDNITWCNNNDFINEVADYYTQITYPKIPNCDPAADLYQAGFLSNETTTMLNKFWQIETSKQKELLPTLPYNKKLLAERLLWRQKPADVFSDELSNYIHAIYGNNTSLIDYRNNSFRTVQQTLSSIEALLLEQKDNLLLEYKQWLLKVWGKLI